MFTFSNISKTFRGKQSLEDVSFSCKPGEMLGVLGPHASGKSVLLKILAGLLQPDSGEILFNDQVVKASFRNNLGYLPEERGLYQQATVLELLCYFGQLRGMSKHHANVEAIRFLDRIQLIHKSKERVFRLEKSELQQVEIIAAIIHNPDVVILDEPFKGLDINNQAILRRIIDSLLEANKIVIMGSHNMEMVESLCQSIIMLNHGQTILSGNAKHILQQYCDDYVSLILDENEEYENFLLGRPEVVDFYEANNEIRVFLKPECSKQDFLKVLSNSMLIYKYQIAQPSLKDLFLKKIPMKEYKEKQALDDQIT